MEAPEFGKQSGLSWGLIIMGLGAALVLEYYVLTSEHEQDTGHRDQIEHTNDFDRHIVDYKDYKVDVKEAIQSLREQYLKDLKETEERLTTKIKTLSARADKRNARHVKEFEEKDERLHDLERHGINIPTKKVE